MCCFVSQLSFETDKKRAFGRAGSTALPGGGKGTGQAQSGVCTGTLWLPGGCRDLSGGLAWSVSPRMETRGL